MTTTLLVVIVLEAAVAALIAVAVTLALRRREHQKLQRIVAIAKREEKARCDFRRPAEFGGLMRPWDEIQKIRKAILKAQLAPSEDELVCVDFCARRCWLPNASHTFQRAGHVDTEAGRVGLRRWLEEPDAGERFDHWLKQWDENPLVALTGRGVAA